MSAQVKDEEAFQRLSFLYQVAHCVLNHLQILLGPPGPWCQLHGAPEKMPQPALDSRTVSLLRPDQVLPKQPSIQAIGGAAQGPAGEPAPSQPETFVAKSHDFITSLVLADVFLNPHRPWHRVNIPVSQLVIFFLSKFLALTVVEKSL
uniref:Uncharacterized protein n=1 Tax=Terrapene triunguis TaxID=2587831 RepID=A0A674J2Z0_9SAUR